eukprot:5099491-Pyramimonas_sp.AAC.1
MALPSLTSLSLGKFGYSETNDLLRTVCRLTALTKLDLCWWDSSQSVLTELLPFLSNLVKLDLSGT